MNLHRPGGNDTKQDTAPENRIFKLKNRTLGIHRKREKQNTKTVIPIILVSCS